MLQDTKFQQKQAIPCRVINDATNFLCPLLREGVSNASFSELSGATYTNFGENIGRTMAL